MAGAALLDKDPYTYQKERDAFLKELWQFHQSRGTAYPHIPKIGGKEVDLYLLYSKVNVLGGWDKVNDSEQWEELLEYFNVPRACTNASSALKNISLRYLYVFQKVQAGDDPDVRQFEADDESARKRKRAPQQSIPMRYNHRQHIVTDSMRQAAGLCMHTNAGHDYVKIERSLLSGLPNEVDFALNVCTLLSNEGRRTIQLASCPQMVQLLLAHVGIFQQSKPGAEGSSYQMLYETGWKPNSKRNFFRFWLDSVEDKEIRDLISPSSLCVDKRGETVGSAQPINMDVAPAVKETAHQPEEKDTSDHSESLSEILNLNRELGLHDVEGQRVMQMAMIIRNLSFDEHNMETLASNLCVFRFLQLCIHSRYASLRQLGLDTLGSICRKMKLDPIDYRTTQLILRTITRCISSQDKFEVTRGLEMLANLSLVADNMYTLSESLEQWVYEDIVNMLLVHDIQLIVHTLETLYQLSELGEASATHIAEVRAAIGILVDLTTVEAQSYGPNSLLGIKVVEHVPPPTPQQLALAQHHHQHPHQHHTSPHHHHHHHHGSPHRPLTHTPQIARAQAPIPVHQLHQVTSHQATPQPSLTPRVGLPQQVAQPTPAQPPPPPVPPHHHQPLPQAAQPVQLKHPEMDAETLACNWLQSHIEVSSQGVMTRVELYAEYLGTCGRLSIRNVINTNSFANCVRVTFPKVDSTRVEKADGSAEIHYRGLKRRDVALPFPSLSNRLGLSIQHKTGGQLPQSQTSPTKGSLIQQQLSSPPQSRRVPPSSLPGVNSATAAQRGPSYPIIQQALLHKGEGSSPLSPPPNQLQFPGSPGPSSPGLRAGSTPDSNLIKSLLANKVTANMHRTHQQQQQQQQQQLPQQPHSAQMLVQGQSPYTSQQPMPSQAPSHPGTVKAELSSGQHEQTGQHQPHPPQGPAQPLQTSLKPSASSQQPQIAIPEGSTGVVQQPPSPRSKLKMTLVAKSAAAAQQQLDNTENLSTQNECQPKAESPSSKPSLIEACIERVQNTYVQKLEEDVVKQNEADLKDSHNSQGVICTTAPEAHELRSEESAVKPELVSNDKTNGLGANGTYNPQQSESHSNNTNNSSISQQMMNGNADKQLDQPQLDTKDIMKSALTESDKLLTPEEIEKRKQEEVAQLLERNKDQVLGLNGIINHVGNGECVIPPYLKGPIPKEIINPDRISGLSLNSHQFKQQMMQQQQQQLLHVEQKPAILENGYAPSQDNNHQERDSKTNMNIPSDLGRSVIGSGPVRNSNSSVISNPEHTLKQEDQGQLNTNSAGDTANAKHKTETPMEVDTADASVRGSNGSGLVAGTASQVAVDDNSAVNKAVGSLTIADILKQREVESPPPTLNSGQQQVVLPLLSVSHSGGLPAALPAAGFMSQLSTIPTIVSTMPQTTVSCTANRPSVLATSVVQTNPQLAKISSEPGNVQSPTLANLPTPGDLASQMKSAMQQPVISVPPTTQTVQASAIMQQLQQPMPQPQQPMPQPQQQQQLVLQAQPQQQQQSPAGSTNFAAHMQQLQQRLQLPPQVTWPLTAQHQTVPIATVAAQQPQQPQQAQPQVLTQPPQLQQALLQQQPQPIQPSIKSQLMQRLQQPLAPARPLLQPQIPGQQVSQAPILLQPHSQPGQQQQQPILLQQQTGVNGQVHQVVVSSNLVMPAVQPTPQVVQPCTLGQTVTLVQSQRQPIQVMSSHGQQVQVMSNTGQALQVVNSQGQPIQVIQGQGQQIQVVAGQGQQLIQGQQVQVMQGGLQVRGQQVQVMPGQCVQMVNGQPQVMQFQVQAGQQIVFQGQAGSTQRLIQPAVSQQQQQVVQPGQVKPAQMLLPRPAQSATPTQQVILVSTSGTTTTGTQPMQVQSAQTQLPQPQQLQLQTQQQIQQTQQPLQQQLQIQTQSPQVPAEALGSPSVSNKRPSTAPLNSDGNLIIKKSRPGGTNSPGMQPSPTTTPAAGQKGDYVCDWAGCKQCFETQKACSTHVVKTHFDGSLDSGFCLWEGCDKLKRQRWSLITHIQDRHLTEHALRTAHVKRQQAAAAAATAGSTAGTAAAPPPVYPQDAALQAIRRFAPHQPYPEFMQKQGGGGQQNPPHQPHRIHTRSKHPPIPPFEEAKEGPVTKHIRLTSGLILRNIAKFSSKGRQLLLKHEKHLADIALSSVEASTAVSHCLWELQHGTTSSEEDSAQPEKH